MKKVMLAEFVEAILFCTEAIDCPTHDLLEFSYLMKNHDTLRLYFI